MANLSDNEDNDEWLPVVIDNGSGIIKYGLAGEEEPKSFMSSVVGRPSKDGQVGMFFLCVLGDEIYYILELMQLTGLTFTVLEIMTVTSQHCKTSALRFYTSGNVNVSV